MSNITSFKKAEEILLTNKMGKTLERRKLANHTYAIRKSESEIAVRLHDTDIVTFVKGKGVRLNSGGWRTMTTRQRINNYLPPGTRLEVNRGVWSIVRMTKHMEEGGGHHFSYPVADKWLYEDGIMLRYSGAPVNRKSQARIEREVKEATRLRKMARDYALRYVNAVEAGEVPLPGAGDCWHCLMKTQDGVAMGDLGSRSDHIESHIEEDYFVPSLAVNALLEKNYREYQLGFILGWDEERGVLGGRLFSKDIVYRAIVNYVAKRLTGVKKTINGPLVMPKRMKV